MTFNAVGREWTVDKLPDLKARRETLRASTVRAAPTALLSVGDVKGSELGVVDEQVEAIEWLLNAATGCVVAEPVRFVVDGDLVAEQRVRPSMVASGGRSNVFYELV